MARTPRRRDGGCRVCYNLVSRASLSRTSLAARTYLREPAGAELRGAARDRRVEERVAGDAIEAEGAEAGAQLAPGDDDASRVAIADHQRPDRALGGAALLVGIVEAQLAAGADPGAQLGDVDAVARPIPGGHGTGGGVAEKGPHFLGQNGGDLGEQI